MNYSLERAVSLFNDEDGKRMWHQKVVGRSFRDGQPGAILWLGSQDELENLPEDLRHQKRWALPKFYSVSSAGALLPRKVIHRADGGALTHIPPNIIIDDINPFEFIPGWLLPAATDVRSIPWIYKYYQNYPCGKYWIGMAQFPLPENWEDSNSSWPGWMHLFHTNQGTEALSAFDFLAERVTEGYPDNPRRLDIELAENLGIDLLKEAKKNKTAAYWKFPWLHPLLNRHPLTGELLDERILYKPE